MQLEEDFIQANPEWVKELQIMVTSKVKAEIQALSSFGFQYLSQARTLSSLNSCVVARYSPADVTCCPVRKQSCS